MSDAAPRGKLIVLCGPTASGKTALGIRLARYLGVPILGADSRQVYRDFDIGTAKPTASERAQADHRLIDLVEPTETFNVARYQALARPEIEAIQATGKPALLVGGSGLYLRAVSGGLRPPAVPADPELRAHLAGKPLVELHEHLVKLDPVAAGRIHPNDRVRIERALEVSLCSGRPMTIQQGRQDEYAVLKLGLVTADRSLLHARIAQRTRTMVANGWIAEVEFLREKYGPDLPLLATLGYAELAAFLEGRTNQETGIEQIVTRTRQFAKRQLTWFRAEPEIHWFDFSIPEEQRWSQVEITIEHFLGNDRA